MHGDDDDASSGSVADELLIDQTYGYTTKQFFARLDASEKAALRVQLFLNKYGVVVEVPKLRRRAKLAEIKAFTHHEADILLTGTPFSIEVKGRPHLEFTEPQDFPYHDVSVDTVSGYNSKKRKPLAYVMVSKEQLGGIVLPTHTERAWRQAPAYDTERRIRDNFYFADKKHFIDGRGWLIDLCKTLQGCTSGAYDPILLAHEFEPGFLKHLYP
jgi:hypothetical protein